MVDEPYLAVEVTATETSGWSSTMDTASEISVFRSLQRTSTEVEKCFRFRARLNVSDELQRPVLVLILLVMLCLAPYVIAEPNWVTRPMNVTQALGSNVSLYCKVNNSVGQKIAWTKLIGESESILFINEESFQAPASYYVTLDGESGSTLHLTSLQRDDDALYRCTIQKSSLTAAARVTVLVDPGVPIVTLNTTDEELKENVMVQLNCSSSGGNPAPVMEWYRNGVRLPNVSVIPPTMKFGTTSFILTWQLSRMDTGATFLCTAENRNVTGSLVNTSISLLVKYAPLIYLGSYNPLVVVNNSLLSLKCNVTAYPEVDPSTVVWYFDGRFIGNGTSHTVTSVTEADAGIYSCSARNFDVRTANVTVDVQYPPRPVVSFREVVAKNGSSVNLTIDFDANPPVKKSGMKWYSGGTVLESDGFLIVLAKKKKVPTATLR